MPPTRPRNNHTLPLNRDIATTRLIARNVQESASETVKELVSAIEDFILNGISSQITPTLQLKYYNNGYTKSQITQNGTPFHDERFSIFDANGYFILQNYRKEIKNHLQVIFPPMKWRTELGRDYIGITIGNYGKVNDILKIKDEEDVKTK